MRQNIVDDIQQYFKNKALNILGVERDLHKLMEDGDVDKAIELMQDRDEEVDNALSEYNPQLHKVMSRPNKFRDGDEPYITCKLPRNLQSYINEVELFFLLGQPIEWKKIDGDDEAFELFKDFIKDSRFNAMIRKAKRLAGAETESALVYHLFAENDEQGNSQVKYIPFVAARSTGYKLRPLFDQYGQLNAFAYGYFLKEGAHSVAHWDILTKDVIYMCAKRQVGWEVEPYPNRIGKIPAVYFQQNKAWFGSEPRLDRLEELDSKAGDTNNYFADPVAMATADVIQSMSTPDKPGRLIQLTGEKSRFEYLAPPQATTLRDTEHRELFDSIMFDTQTPDFNIEKMRGLGTLSGAAIKNSFILGFLKRDNRRETWDEYMDRLRSVIIAILKAVHPDKEKILNEVKIGFEFADPFASDRSDKWASIQSLYTSGVASLETVVSMLGLTNSNDDEINRIIAMEMDREFTAKEAQGVNEGSAEEQDMKNKGVTPPAPVEEK